MWDNQRLHSLIKDKSTYMARYLLPRKPQYPINNREELDRIQGQDPDDKLTGQIVKAITLGASCKPIPKDHSYTDTDILDFKEYYESIEEWAKEIEITENRENESIPDILPMSIVYSREKEKFILVMSSGSSYVRELNIDPMDNVVGGRYTPYLRYFDRATLEEVEDYLSNTDFDQLRLRLINAGYTEFVSVITEQLEGY